MRGWRALGLGLALVLGGIQPAGAWSVVPREGTYGVGIQWREGQWEGQLMLPTTAGAPSLAKDKVQHLLAGAVIATFLRLTGADASTAMGAALAAGTFKELGDTGRIPGMARGHVEFGDWVATGFGGLLGVLSTQALQIENRDLSGPVSARDGT